MSPDDNDRESIEIIKRLINKMIIDKEYLEQIFQDYDVAKFDSCPLSKLEHNLIVLLMGQCKLCGHK